MLRNDSFSGFLAATAVVLASAPSAVRAQGQVLDYYLTHAGYQRHFLLYVPSGYTPGNGTPLVIALHGGGQTGVKLMDISGMNEVAELEGFLVAYPDAIGGMWLMRGPGHADDSDPYDDVGFIDALLVQVSSG